MRILVGVDGSPGSVAAAALGGLLCAASRGTLVLAHVTEEEAPARGGAELAGELAEYRRKAAEHALSLAREAAAPFAAVMEERVLIGTPAEAILAAAHADTFDMIALGKRRAEQGLLQRLFAGSTVLQVLDDTELPVLIAPDGMHRDARPPEIASVLVPTDGSRASLEAAELAAQIAALTRAAVWLIHVEENPVPEGFAARAFSAEERERLQSEQAPLGRTILHATQEPFLKRGLAVDILDTQGSPAERILQTAQDGAISLIVMGSYGAGESFLERRRLGSVTEAVLAQAVCPVIVVKRPVPGGD